jgi:hypothetical protein
MAPFVRSWTPPYTANIKMMCLTIRRYCGKPFRLDFQKVNKLDCRFGIAKLPGCKIDLYPSISEWIPVEEKIINEVTICDITIDDASQKFYLLLKLPQNDEWLNIVSTLELTGNADLGGNITPHQLSFEATLRRTTVLSPDATVFVTIMDSGRNSHGDGMKGDS